MKDIKQNETASIDATRQIMVSVCCLVYNHEPFLRVCFDGFVMQKTTFPIEILVHDDASTDHSVDIIREYTAKYPDLFKPIYQAENQYSKGVDVFSLNARRAQGKYIAVCEGDDYWTDPMKLQKQVEFMEANPDFSLCCHNAKVWKQQDGVMVDDFILHEAPSDTDIYELSKYNYIYTLSVVYRNKPEIFRDYLNLGYMGVGDYPLWMVCAQYGKIHKINECLGVYRYGSGFWSTNTNIVKKSFVKTAMLAKLAVVINDTQSKSILDEQIASVMNYNIALFEKLQHDIEGIRNSKTYRLGALVAKPYTIIRNLLKNFHGEK